MRYFNRRYARTGGLFDGRYRSLVIDSDRYGFKCMRYVELNPVRAGITVGPEEYRWSSYRFHALGERDDQSFRIVCMWLSATPPRCVNSAGGRSVVKRLRRSSSPKCETWFDTEEPCAAAIRQRELSVVVGPDPGSDPGRPHLPANLGGGQGDIRAGPGGLESRLGEAPHPPSCSCARAAPAAARTAPSRSPGCAAGPPNTPSPPPPHDLPAAGSPQARDAAGSETRPAR